MLRLLVVAAIAASLLTARPAPAAEPPARHVLQESDLRALVALSDPHIAPDGKHVALIVRRADFVKNKYLNELVLVDARSGATRTLVHDLADVQSPRWSPAGDRLAFVATPPKDPDDKDEPSPQLYVLRMDGGEPARITGAKNGVEFYAWRPDGRAFAYITRDDSPDAARIKAHDDWFEIGDNAWTSRANRAPAHLWTVDAAAGKKAQRITHGTWSLENEPAFASGGRRVYVTRTPQASTNHYRARAVVAIDVASGSLISVGPDHSDAPAVSPGGHLIYAAEHPQAFAQREVFVANANGAHARDLSARLDRNVQFGLFAPDDRVVVGANDGTRSRLFALDADGTPHVLPLGEVDLAGSATASRDGTLAFVGATPAHPSELYVLHAGAAKPQRLTHDNDVLATRTLGRTRTLTWRSADNFAVDGVLTEPPGGMVAGKKYPLMVLIHGGPTATSTEAFSPLAQLMAARGWLVFQPNYRGSDNLGKRFAMATVPRITSAPGRDVLDGIDAVQKLGIVDATRIGVSGWSEGGLLTSWLITQDHRWRAAMSGAAVNDWTGYSDMTDAQDFSPSFIGPSPWSSEKMRALYAAESPLTYAANVKTPTLILTDAGDQRVPTPLSYEFFHAVRATGTPVEMIVFPVNGHNPSDPLHREERTHIWIDWFAKHF